MTREDIERRLKQAAEIAEREAAEAETRWAELRAALREAATESQSNEKANMTQRYVHHTDIPSIAANDADFKALAQRAGKLNSERVHLRQAVAKLRPQVQSARSAATRTKAMFRMGLTTEAASDAAASHLHKLSRQLVDSEAKLLEADDLVKAADQIVEEAHRKAETVLRKNLSDPAWRKKHNIITAAGDPNSPAGYG